MQATKREQEERLKEKEKELNTLQVLACLIPIFFCWLPCVSLTWNAAPAQHPDISHEGESMHGELMLICWPLKGLSNDGEENGLIKDGILQEKITELMRSNKEVVSSNSEISSAAQQQTAATQHELQSARDELR